MPVREEIEERLRELARRAGLKDAPPAAVVAGLVVACVAVAWAAWQWWPRGGAVTGGIGVEQVAARSKPTTPAPAVETSPAVVVHVVGAVRHPGVYELASDSRVAAAIDAAGGALPNAVLAAVNLARPISDGEQILVPTEDEVASGAGAGATAAGGAPVPGGAAGGGGSAAGAPVNINTADAAALDTLPGVGPSTAQKIVVDREANGPFTTPEDLGRVSGIGPKKLEQLKGLVSVR